MSNQDYENTIALLDERLSHAWEVAHKAVERGMELEAENAKLKDAVIKACEDMGCFCDDVNIHLKPPCPMCVLERDALLGGEE